jgi:hypothetical protein
VHNVQSFILLPLLKVDTSGKHEVQNGSCGAGYRAQGVEPFLLAQGLEFKTSNGLPHVGESRSVNLPKAHRFCSILEKLFMNL